MNVCCYQLLLLPLAPRPTIIIIDIVLRGYLKLSGLASYLTTLEMLAIVTAYHRVAFRDAAV